jgi:transcriptional regulator with XRE-family HTH domain
MEQDILNNLIYGIILKNSRNKLDWTQEKLSIECKLIECNISRETIVAIENGRTPPKRSSRETFAKILGNPVLEYFPPYSVGNFSQRLEVRFQHEKEAVRYFLEGFEQEYLDSLKAVYSLYRLESTQNNFRLMISLDEYLHTLLMDFHPNQSTRILVAGYRQDYIDFFKIWLPHLSFGENIGFNMSAEQDTIHFEIFEAIFEQNQSQLIQAIDRHLDNSLEDVERLTTSLL